MAEKGTEKWIYHVSYVWTIPDRKFGTKKTGISDIIVNIDDSLKRIEKVQELRQFLTDNHLEQPCEPVAIIAWNLITVTLDA